MRAIAEVADYLGRAIANIVTMLVPERVVIGGGVAEAGDALLDPVREATARHCVLVPPEWYEIVVAASDRAPERSARRCGPASGRRQRDGQAVCTTSMT